MKQAEPAALPPSPALLRLAAEMQQPRPSVTITQLQQLWQHDDIEIVCWRPPDMEDAPDLAQRVRGALGNMLEKLCLFAPKRPDPFERETAYDLLFNWTNPKIPVGRQQREVAVPMVISAIIEKEEIRVTIRLLGSAALHVSLVRGAAELALQEGVSLRIGAPRVPLTVKRSTWKRFDGGSREWLTLASSLVLRLVSPVIIRSGQISGGSEEWQRQGLRLEPQAVVRSAILRCHALAPWMGWRLEADMVALEKALQKLAYEIDILPESWVRHSKRRKGREIPVEAYSGRIRLSGQIESLLPFVELAQCCSIGSSCASGFGMFEMISYP